MQVVYADQSEVDSLASRVLISTAVLISNHHYYQYEPGSGITDGSNNYSMILYVYPYVGLHI